jgi:gamma-glutamyltranspeptidase / glutathione hydrolase
MRILSEVRLSRRRWLQLGGAGLLMLHVQPAPARTADSDSTALIIGHPQAAEAGMRVLADGGNAIDAVVAAALVAGVVAVPMCGIGGYGGHMVVGWPDGRASSIDFNSAAPASARGDMYPLDDKGRVRGAVNHHGWQSAGVPGTMAGLQLALDRFGTWKLGRAIEPAIRFARDGFRVDARLARSIRSAEQQFRGDPGSAKLFFVDGRPLAEGDTYRNTDLAAMLEKLAAADSVDDFYRGRIAAHIAREFKKHGGLVTEADLAAYHARQVEPLTLEWCDRTIYTAPLTAGGLSVIQTLATLKALEWEKTDSADPRSTHARIEALRLAWHDRLSLLGDPAGTDVPVRQLLSPQYADQSAARVRRAVERQRLIPARTDGRSSGGTVHLTAVDKSGMMVALTLTHGEGFGARVTVEGLGLVLGHGMSRFDPTPGHPNAPRSGTRPLNNMCPTLIFAENRPVVALGATGGRRIPNTLCDVLEHLVGRGWSLSAAAAVPRLHTEGDAVLRLAKGWISSHVDYLTRVGYTIQPGAGANLNGITRDPSTGTLAHVP